MNIRKVMSMGFTLLGMILVFSAILVPAISLNIQLQLFVVLAGLLIIETGVWNLTQRFLPSTRKHLSLRAEVDHFISQIRTLNSQGKDLLEEETESSREAFRETLRLLHESVDRMGEAAGRDP